MTCETGEDLDRCPTKTEILPRLLMLLPRGRAWGNHDGGPWPGSVLHGFWSALAEMAEYVNERICALMAEFNCGTAVETVDLWASDYGLPDPCDPYADLCDKVRAVGSARCEYYVEVAARHGWSVTCIDSGCGAEAGLAEADCAVAGETFIAGTLVILVDLEASSAYVAPSEIQAEAGLIEAGYRVRCAPDFSSLECVMRRVVQAHLDLVIEPYAAPNVLMWGEDKLMWAAELLVWQ